MEPIEYQGFVIKKSENSSTRPFSIYRGNTSLACRFGSVAAAKSKIDEWLKEIQLIGGASFTIESIASLLFEVLYFSLVPRSFMLRGNTEEQRRGQYFALLRAFNCLLDLLTLDSQRLTNVPKDIIISELSKRFPQWDNSAWEKIGLD